MNPYLPPGPNESNRSNANTIKLVVMSDSGMLTRAQEGQVEYLFTKHKSGVSVALGGHFVSEGKLSDGSRVRITTNSGAHTIAVWPAEVTGIKYELLPAFWLNAPDNGEEVEEPINSATWLGLPYDAEKLPHLKEFQRVEHPGNQTWYDSRADSPNRGLVLSWWGISQDRYGTVWRYPNTMAEPSPTERYNQLWCNGVLIGQIGTAIHGACITEVDGVPTIAVVTSSKRKLDIGGEYIFFYGSGFDGIDTASSYLGSDIAFTLWHAPLPADFRKFLFRRLDFTSIVTKPLALRDSTFDIGGTAYWFTNRALHRAANAIKFNTSGTQGVIDVRGFVGPSTGTVSTGYVWAVFIDPRDGTLVSELKSANTTQMGEQAVADHYGLTLADVSSGVWWYDYVGDTLTRFVTGVPQVSPGVYRAFGYSTFHGFLFETPFAGGPNFGLGDPRFLGDLRVGLAVVFTAQRMYRALNGTLLEDVPYTTPYFSTLAQGGFEGGDSSFDGRLIVSINAGVVRVFIDGVDVSEDLNDPEFKLQDIRYPVLCGPLARKDGKTRPPKTYIKEEE